MSEEPHFYALRITPRAAADIDAAYARLVELTDVEIADDWKAGLLEAVAPLAFMSHRQIAPEQARFQQEIRQIIYRRRTGSVAYRVLFTIVEEKDDASYVRVLHVRHGAARPITRAEAKEIEAAM